MIEQEISDSAKRALRQAMMIRRAECHATDAAGASAALARFVLPLLDEVSVSVVAGYVPLKTEIDPMPLLVALLRPGVTTALPVVVGRGEPLQFRRWVPGGALEAGAFGTSHPAASEDEVLPDLLLVPLLAFDRQRRRLGYGAGFYDRTLAILRQQKPVTAIGVAFADQEVDEVPVDPWDQPLDFIVTERGVI